MTNLIATDAQDLEIDSGLVELYELEIGTGSNNTLFFHPGKDLDNGTTDKDLIFDGNTYIALPIMMDNIEKSATGAMNRPKLTIANVESIIKTGSDFKTQMEDGTWDATIDGEALPATEFEIDDLVGQRITRRVTLEKYTGSGVTAYEFDKEVFIIDRIAAKTAILIELELSAPVDLAGIRLPRRQVIGKYCPWLYQGHHTKSKTSSACFWKTKNQIEDENGNFYSFYFTKDDEPLVLNTRLAGNSTSFWKGAYSAGTTYASGEYVSNGGLFWRSEKDSNTGNTPSETSIFWQIVRTYSQYSSSTAYSVHATDPRRNDYVLSSDTVWRAIAANTGVTPGTNQNVWVRGDVCGKLLKSCKSRYQVIPKATGSGYTLGGIPHKKENTYQALPFGGFPGSRKFR